MLSATRPFLNYTDIQTQAQSLEIMPEQGKITRFLSNAGRKRSHSHRKHRNEDAKHLTEEQLKLRAHLSTIGEQTRAAYADVERQHPRVKAAYSKTYMTTRCAPILMSTGYPTLAGVSVIDADTLDAAASLRAAAPKAAIGVMNMASDRHVGGGFLSGAPAQEESLCRRSTLYPCLLSVKNKCYPLAATAVLVSPDVLVFRAGSDRDFKPLNPPDSFYVTVLSVAAIRNPRIQNDRFENHMERQMTATKVRETLRAAYHAGCRQLVLGALGCGAFHNPPKAIAEIFRDVLAEGEFRAAFDKIVFAVIDSKELTYGKEKTNNFAIFRQILHRSPGATNVHELPRVATNAERDATPVCPYCTRRHSAGGQGGAYKCFE